MSSMFWKVNKTSRHLLFTWISWHIFCLFFLSDVTATGNFENYIKGPEFHASLNDLFGDGIFNANGEEWKYQRKTASHIFNVKNFRDQFTE